MSERFAPLSSLPPSLLSVATSSAARASAPNSVTYLLSRKTTSSSSSKASDSASTAKVCEAMPGEASTVPSSVPMVGVAPPLTAVSATAAASASTTTAPAEAATTAPAEAATTAPAEVATTASASAAAATTASAVAAACAFLAADALAAPWRGRFGAGEAAVECAAEAPAELGAAKAAGGSSLYERGARLPAAFDRWMAYGFSLLPSGLSTCPSISGLLGTPADPDLCDRRCDALVVVQDRLTGVVHVSTRVEGLDGGWELVQPAHLDAEAATLEAVRVREAELEEGPRGWWIGLGMGTHRQHDVEGGGATVQPDAVSQVPDELHEPSSRRQQGAEQGVELREGSKRRPAQQQAPSLPRATSVCLSA
eukprot:3817835-Prymnesium_polylepis.2